MERFLQMPVLHRLGRWLAAFGTASAMTLAAHAQDPAPADNNFTSAGTSVSNTFTLDYQVNAVNQDTITNGDGTGVTSPTGTVDAQNNPTLFTVDRLINHVVQDLNSPQVATPGGSATLTFRVTNTGNDNQAYSFSIFDEGGAAADEIDATYTLTFRPEGAPGPGTSITVVPTGNATADFGIGELTTDLAPDDSLIVEVVGTVAAGAVDANFDDLRLVAQAREPSAFIVTSGPTGATATRGATAAADGDNTNVVTGVAENVLADGDGDAGGAAEVANDGLHSDAARIDVDVPDPNLFVEKVVGVLATSSTETGVDCAAFEAVQPTESISRTDGSGPFTATVAGFSPAQPSGAVDTEQFGVPGSCVEYIIRVLNRTPGVTGNATTTATGINIIDELPAQLSYVDAQSEGFDTAPTEGTSGAASPPDCASAVPAPSPCAVRFTGGEMENNNNLGAIRIRAVVQ